MTKFCGIKNRETFIKAIDNYIIGYKSQRNRELLKDHFIEGMTFEEVAEKYELTSRQAKRIVKGCMEIINENISFHKNDL